jgi:hypothetical protein
MPSKKRQYIKKSKYWNKFNSAEDSGNKPLNDNLNEILDAKGNAPEAPDPIFAGENYYATASYNRSVRDNPNSSNFSRRNGVYFKTKNYRLANIEQGMLPFEYSADGVDVRAAIELCQKAYANVAVFRNSIDIMSELSNSDIKLIGGNKKVRDFIYKWMEQINIVNLKSQYFREYYRSGNVFFFRVDGKFKTEDYLKMSRVYAEVGIKPGMIPLKYILLNPYDITADNSMTFKADGSQAVYTKVLSQYDIERLSSPQTEYDKEILNSLPAAVKKNIKDGTYNDDGIKVFLDPSRLIYSFYKKQDYEPFAIPFGYPVLDDINWKIELKKIDQAVSRTIENVILLITMGAPPDKGGINPQNLKAMQSLFQNESVGRVLVSDHTTKAEFVLPDIEKIIGPDKYRIVNEDIREGLQNIIVGNDKYSNTEIKAKIFLERLRESREAFLADFLQPQIKLICKNLGFRKYPIAKFEEVSLKDEAQLQRVITRLMELGILTPEQGIEAIKTGIYPDANDMIPGQKEYLKNRQEGLFTPLVGGSAPILQELEDEGEEKKSTPAAPKVNGQPGRPSGTKGIPQDGMANVSRKKIQNTVYALESLNKKAESLFRAKKNKKRLNKGEKNLIDQLCESISSSLEKENWESKLGDCIDDFDEIESLKPLKSILDLAEEYNLSLYPASILWHSTKEK